MRDSNPRPPRCKRDALPAELIARQPPCTGACALRPPSADSIASIKRVAQTLARLELRLLRSRDLDFFAGAWIAPFGGRPRGDGECAESDEAHLVAALQRLRDGIEYRVDSLARLRFSEFGLACHGVDAFVCVDGWPP